MELGDKERDGGLPNYFGAQEFTFFGLQTFLERKNLHFSASKLFWSTRIYIFRSPNFFGAQEFTIFGLQTFLERKELHFSAPILIH